MTNNNANAANMGVRRGGKRAFCPLEIGSEAKIFGKSEIRNLILIIWVNPCNWMAVSLAIWHSHWTRVRFSAVARQPRTPRSGGRRPFVGAPQYTVYCISKLEPSLYPW